MKPSPAPWCVGGEAADVTVIGLPPAAAEDLFLRRHQELEAIATEARRAETENTGSVHEGAGPQDIAPTPSPNSQSGAPNDKA